ncbi:MAG: DNA pilot protein [Arizlama microvirus]|nr:MAG: DNA pilot protein [Arizlama microvirus]
MWPAIIAAGASLAGGLLSRKSANDSADQNVKMQREFAQKGIQWKVADAKKAGLHPLAALGAQTTSFSPVSISDGMGAAVSNMGQDISRAMYANADNATRQTSKELAALALERGGLENELLRAQIAKLNGQVGPPPTAYPVDAGAVLTRDLVELKPSEVVSARSGEPHIEAGPAGPGYKAFDLGDLGEWNLPSGAVSEAVEDMDIAKYALLGAANHEKLGRLKNLPAWLAFKYATRPDWVKQLERTHHRILIPFYRADGKVYWKGIGQPVRR